MRIRLALVMVLFSQAFPASAGVFNLPRFVVPGDFGVGLEPEFTFAPRAAVGVNLRYTHGLTEMNDLSLLIGTGTGYRRFRAGAAMTLDVFPDIEGQPGLGAAVQGIYYRYRDASVPGDVKTGGLFEGAVTPYIHKTFVGKSSEFEPFVAYPLGIELKDGTYRFQMTLALGSAFSSKGKIRYVAEVGVNVANAQSYFSGGVTYYH